VNPKFTIQTFVPVNYPLTWFLTLLRYDFHQTLWKKVIATLNIETVENNEVKTYFFRILNLFKRVTISHLNGLHRMKDQLDVWLTGIELISGGHHPTTTRVLEMVI
jgi:hypothetical protein